MNWYERGGDDIRCTVEVHMEGRPAQAVKHHASDLQVAVDAAVDKMARMLDHQLGKLRDQQHGNGKP